jgi:uncharacterized membrane-anchored protein
MALSVTTLCRADQAIFNAPVSRWLHGPAIVALSEAATLRVPKDCMFLDRPNTQALLDELECFTSGFEVGLIASKSGDWSIVVEVREVGYVSDEDWDPRAARSLLAAIAATTQQLNEERKQNGWAAVHVLDWAAVPAYDFTNHAIQWAIRAESDGTRLTNRTIAVLFRRGLINFILVDQHGNLEAERGLNELVRGLEFKTGMQYEESRPGDSLALGGLASVVLGTTESDFAWPDLDEALAGIERPGSISARWWIAGTVASLLGFVAGRRFSRRGRRMRHGPIGRTQIGCGDVESVLPPSSTPALGESMVGPGTSVSSPQGSGSQPIPKSRGRHRRFDAYSFHQRLTRDLHWTHHQ